MEASKPTSGVVPPSTRESHADERTRPFWDAAVEGRLIAPRCTSCATFVLPPQPYCFQCASCEFEWISLPGTGTIYSFTVVRHSLRPELHDVVPYAAGVIELDGTQGAGARMIGNITGCDVDALKIGDRVRVEFEPISDTFALPRFLFTGSG